MVNVSNERIKFRVKEMVKREYMLSVYEAYLDSYVYFNGSEFGALTYMRWIEGIMFQRIQIMYSNTLFKRPTFKLLESINVNNTALQAGSMVQLFSDYPFSSIELIDKNSMDEFRLYGIEVVGYNINGNRLKLPWDNKLENVSSDNK